MTTYKIISKMEHYHASRHNRKAVEIIEVFPDLKAAQAKLLDMFNYTYDKCYKSLALAAHNHPYYICGYDGEYCFDDDIERISIEETEGNEFDNLEDLVYFFETHCFEDSVENDIIDKCIEHNGWDDLRGNGKQICSDGEWILTKTNRWSERFELTRIDEDEVNELNGAIYCTNGDAVLVEDEESAMDLYMHISKSSLRKVEKSEYDEVLPKLNLTKANNVRCVWAFDGGYYCLAEDFTPIVPVNE